ncbi:MAG: S1 RNA-binding domain-containing protein [Ruminococcus sp.]|nr:S1 RNA-binding domain-containing protein [Ruminococcus sp.]
MLEIGAIVDGKVTGLTGFGAFVALPDGSSGMVHISEVSNTFVKDIKDFLSEGQEVKVKVIGINDEGKISLSIKKAAEPTGESRPRNNRGGQRKPRQVNAWQGQPHKSTEGMSFEDMMAHFKQVSDEKMTDLKRSGESKHGGGYSRRGGNKNY